MKQITLGILFTNPMCQLGLLTNIVATQTSPPTQAERPNQSTCPNILFIMSDDHACNTIGAYGSRLAKVAPKPNIDRIVKEGIRLNKCFVSNSISTRSRAVILPGQHTSMRYEPAPQVRPISLDPPAMKPL